MCLSVQVFAPLGQAAAWEGSGGPDQRDLSSEPRRSGRPLARGFAQASHPADARSPRVEFLPLLLLNRYGAQVDYDI